MNYRMIGYLLGVMLLIESAFMVIPTVASLIYGESVVPFVITIAALLVCSLPAIIFRPKNRRIYAKEGFVTAAGGWLLMSVFGALPFVIGGAIPNFFNAFFETVSGFTTTGATILSTIEGLPKGVLLWRSLTHWMGGMGVLVFVLAILPSSGGQTMHLMRAEVPGPTKGKLVPKMRQTAIILYVIYIILTCLEIIALLFCNLSFYDALVNALSTAGTGGFSVLNNSIGGYNNPAAEWVIAVFMFLFGINFNMFFFIFVRRIKDVFRSEELRTYFVICTASYILIAINTLSMFDSVWDAIRSAVFHVNSIISTTGFATLDFNQWPDLSKTILVILMLFGACAGSTAGGLKLSRVIILVKSIGSEIKHVLRPNSVNVVKLDGEVVPEETVKGANRYLTIYITVFVITVLVLSFEGFGFETNFTAALCCINNIGLGLGRVSPAGNFADFSYFSKFFLSIIMLVGRLEIMPMIILLSPLTWRKR